MNTLSSFLHCVTCALGTSLLTLLSGCSSFSVDDTLARTREHTAGFTEGTLVLARTQQHSAELDRIAAQLLSQPLAQADAVRLAWVNSPALQAVLAQSLADGVGTAQSARLTNPVLAWERIRTADELEIGRLLSFGVMQLLTQPQRAEAARQQLVQQQLRLSTRVIEQVTEVRQLWVKAVAAQQSLAYAVQVSDAAQASGALAARMHSAGNFSKLQQARQQAFHGDAVTQLATARHGQVATREALVRQLGLTDAQAATLRLPEHLPALPVALRPAVQLTDAARAQRLDIRLAQAELDALTAGRSAARIGTFTEVELGLRRDTVFDNARGTATARNGFSLDFKLPLFDDGSLLREGLDAQALAAAQRLRATVRAANSNLRESYSAYQTAWDAARHYRDELLPLRKTIAQESLLRYNGMLTGVFELIADARDQVSSVIAAIAAEQQFWLADAALQAAVTGLPTGAATAGAP